MTREMRAATVRVCGARVDVRGGVVRAGLGMRPMVPRRRVILNAPGRHTRSSTSMSTSAASLHGGPTRFDDERARAIAASFDLTHLPADFYADPYPYYHALRTHAPAKRMPDGSLLLTRYEDIVPVYRDPRLFSSDKNKEFGPKFGPSPLLEHTGELGVRF